MFFSNAMNKPAPTYASHFGVYALILNATKDSALLIKKSLGCYTGLYDLPGGSMEPDELLEETLCREVLEETDCKITSYEQLCTVSTLYPFKKDGKETVLRHIGTVYVAEITGTPRTHATGLDDSDGCVWIPLKDITLKNTVPLVVDAVKIYAEKT
jgi:ADP-ribose pyrophosphatase YjhB (NUDIX family)